MIESRLMRVLGAPVEIRARRLARAFLDQTRRAADRVRMADGFNGEAAATKLSVADFATPVR